MRLRLSPQVLHSQDNNRNYYISYHKTGESKSIFNTKALKTLKPYMKLYKMKKKVFNLLITLDELFK